MVDAYDHDWVADGDREDLDEPEDLYVNDEPGGNDDVVQHREDGDDPDDGDDGDDDEKEPEGD